MIRRRMQGRYPVLLVLLTSLFLSSAPAQFYEMIELPMQYPTAINDSGVVLGVSGGMGLMWEDGIALSLGSFNFGGLNNQKHVAGSAWVSAETTHAFIWDNFNLIPVGTLGGIHTHATSINESLEVAGYGFSPDGQRPGFFWKNGVMTQITPPGVQSVHPAGINDSGQVVGTSQVNDTLRHACLWRNGNFTDLPTLGGNIANGNAVNNLGHVVGWSTIIEYQGGSATLWRDGGATDLGFLVDDSLATSTAMDINDKDEIVGISSHDPVHVRKDRAFIWKEGIMTDLNSLTDTSGGWVLTMAVGINNEGDIACKADYHGQQRGVLLRRGDLRLVAPEDGDRWVSAEKDTIRWQNGLPPGSNVALRYMLEDDQIWRLIDDGIAADLERYAWDVPDTLSSKVRILISSESDPDKNDTTGHFRIRGYVLARVPAPGDTVAYSSELDRWGFGNDSGSVWPASWHSRFDYTGIDPLTGRNYLWGPAITSLLFFAARASDHPDWPSFVRAFGTDYCYASVGLSFYSPSAVLLWAAIKGAWRGSCFGFAISNAIAFRNKTEFRNRYSHYPDYLSANQAGSDTNTIPVINELFTRQYRSDHLEYLVQARLTKSPTQTLQELRANFLNDDVPVQSMNIYNNSGAGGHAILPYKILKDAAQPNLHRIFVYDNSHQNVLDAAIVVDTAANGGKGSWSYSLWPGWGGNKGMMLCDQAIGYLTPPDAGSHTEPPNRSAFLIPDSLVQIHTASSGSVRILDTSGRATGYFDTLVHEEIPESVPLTILNGSETPPYGYRLPRGRYNLSQTGVTEDASEVFFFDGNRSFAALRSGVTQAQTDRFSYDGNLSLTNPDPEIKAYDIFAVTDNGPQGEYSFLLRDVSLMQDDSVRTESLPGDGLKFSLFGPASRSYRLNMEHVTDSAARAFGSDSVPLAGNSSHFIQPDWETLDSLTLLRIMIDLNNDGSIDDSLLVGNRVTGIGDPRSPGIPETFALHQNYPNPFNSTTRIRYELPKAVHVTLRVYDVFGGEIATLANGVQGPGVSTLEWNAGDRSSGVYFLKLQTADFTSMKKMLLIK